MEDDISDVGCSTFTTDSNSTEAGPSTDTPPPQPQFQSTLVNPNTATQSALLDVDTSASSANRDPFNIIAITHHVPPIPLPGPSLLAAASIRHNIAPSLSQLPPPPASLLPPDATSFPSPSPQQPPISLASLPLPSSTLLPTPSPPEAPPAPSSLPLPPSTLLPDTFPLLHLPDHLMTQVLFVAWTTLDEKDRRALRLTSQTVRECVDHLVKVLRINLTEHFPHVATCAGPPPTLLTGSAVEAAALQLPASHEVEVEPEGEIWAAEDTEDVQLDYLPGSDATILDLPGAVAGNQHALAPALVGNQHPAAALVGNQNLPSGSGGGNQLAAAAGYVGNQNHLAPGIGGGNQHAVAAGFVGDQNNFGIELGGGNQNAFAAALNLGQNAAAAPMNINLDALAVLAPVAGLGLDDDPLPYIMNPHHDALLPGMDTNFNRGPSPMDTTQTQLVTFATTTNKTALPSLNDQGAGPSAVNANQIESLVYGGGMIQVGFGASTSTAGPSNAAAAAGSSIAVIAGPSNAATGATEPGVAAGPSNASAAGSNNAAAAGASNATLGLGNPAPAGSSNVSVATTAPAGWTGATLSGMYNASAASGSSNAAATIVSALAGMSNATAGSGSSNAAPAAPESSNAAGPSYNTTDTAGPSNSATITTGPSSNTTPTADPSNNTPATGSSPAASGLYSTSVAGLSSVAGIPALPEQPEDPPLNQDLASSCSVSTFYSAASGADTPSVSGTNNVDAGVDGSEIATGELCGSCAAAIARLSGRFPNLVRLSVRDGNVDNFGPCRSFLRAALGGWSRLRALALKPGSQVTLSEEDIRLLGQVCPQLEQLYVPAPLYVDALCLLPEALPRLNTLHFGNFWKTPPLGALAPLSSLTCLQVRAVILATDSMHGLSMLTSLRELRLGPVYHMTPAELAPIIHLPSLRCLHLWAMFGMNPEHDENGLSNSDLEAFFTRMTRLQALSLHNFPGGQADDGLFRALSRLPDLRALRVNTRGRLAQAPAEDAFPQLSKLHIGGDKLEVKLLKGLGLGVAKPRLKELVIESVGSHSVDKVLKMLVKQTNLCHISLRCVDGWPLSRLTSLSTLLQLETLSIVVASETLRPKPDVVAELQLSLPAVRIHATVNPRLDLVKFEENLLPEELQRT